jgi:hypothetical protein
MKEVWKDIKDFDNKYQISNIGRVKSLPMTVVNKYGVIQHRKEKIRKLYKGNHGYYVVSLKDNMKQVVKTVHRMVAEAFLEKIEGSDYVNHKSGIKTENNIENLEYCTMAENTKHSFDLGMSKKGSQCSYAKLDEKKAREAYYMVTELKMSCLDVGQLYNVTRQCISELKFKRSWKHIHSEEV